MGKPKAIRPTIKMQWLSTVDAGKQLELYSDTAGAPYQLVTVVADEADESLWLELYVDGTLLQIPVATLQEAFAASEGVVHSEAWFEANVYGLDDSGMTAAARAHSKR